MKPMVILIVATLFVSAPAVAQRGDEQARALRERGRRALTEGRIEEAFGLFRVAAERTSDPDVWLDVGDAADRLRMDAVAVEAYQTFLERAPAARNRAEIEGRLRVLRHHIGGARFALGPDGQTIAMIVDLGGAARSGAAPAPRHHSILVDWQGNPQPRPRSTELLSLAEWDGQLRSPDPPTVPGGAARAPEPGMGRALSAP